MKMLLYVPATAPMARHSSNSRMLGPPISSMAISTNSVVRLVFSERPMLSMMLRFTSPPRSRSGWRTTFSRMRSNTTMVSLTL